MDTFSDQLEVSDSENSSYLTINTKNIAVRVQCLDSSGFRGASIALQKQSESSLENSLFVSSQASQTNESFTVSLPSTFPLKEEGYLCETSKFVVGVFSNNRLFSAMANSSSVKGVVNALVVSARYGSNVTSGLENSPVEFRFALNETVSHVTIN